MSKQVFKGNIMFTPTKDSFKIYENSYIMVEDGKVAKVSKDLDNSYKNVWIRDYGDKLIIPGFIDIHLHAPQYSNRGLGMDDELIPWLNNYTFPEEGKFKDLGYSKVIFSNLLHDLWRFGTTRSLVYSSIFKGSTALLMDMFMDSGLGAYVGKVNMDKNSAEYLTEKTQQSIDDTEELILKYKDKSSLVKPIITPRFVPTCSAELMEGLGKLAKKYDVPVQSHLNENTSEIIWVSELFPESKNYSSVYDEFGLFGQTTTIMGHCVYNNKEEMKLMAENKVYVAHCPYSNLNLSSGMIKVREYLDMNIPIGLGSDISGGHTLNMTSVIRAAIEMSKMVWLDSDKELAPLTLSEAFYLATKGGGSLFGKVGSFEEGYEFDALIIDDSALVFGSDLTLDERLQKYIYIGDDRNILERYVSGNMIEEPKKAKFN